MWLAPRPRVSGTQSNVCILQAAFYAAAGLPAFSLVQFARSTGQAYTHPDLKV